MREKRRKGRVPTETSVEDEIVHLRGLDLKGLRARWQSVSQRPAPDHLPRHLLFAIIAYRIQADRFGDLDHMTRQLLGHVWTTPALQEESDVRLAVGCKSCVRPVCAAP